MATSKPGNRGLQRTGWLRSTSQLADASSLSFFFTRLYVCSLKSTGQSTVSTEHQNPCKHLVSDLRQHLLDCFCFQSKPGNSEDNRLWAAFDCRGWTHTRGQLWRRSQREQTLVTLKTGQRFVSAKFDLKAFLSNWKVHMPQPRAVKWTSFKKEVQLSKPWTQLDIKVLEWKKIYYGSHYITTYVECLCE